MSIRNEFVFRIIAFTTLLNLVFLPSGIGQLTVNGGFTATQLAQQLAGQGVAFSNVQLTCPTGAYGTFDGTLSNIGIDQGVLLTSGSIGNAIGPNTQTGVTTNNNAPGDADLSVITAPSATFDACVLEFDLQVNSDSLVFNYVFGSDEYHEYVNSAFNDVFAFFISGPGITGQQNIAIIPGTTTPVSINNVNNGNFTCPGPPTGPCSWCQFFVNNCNGATVEYDAFTTVLTATIGGLLPCQTYHLKLAVSDAGDGILDSGVFLEAGSFVAVNVEILPTTSVGFGFNNAVEGCVDGIFEFHLDPPPVDTYQVNYTIGGTALNGIDYAMIPDSIVFMPGDTFGELIIQTFADSIIEGLESVTLYLVNECTGLPYDSATLMIQDSVFAIATAADDTICRGELVQLNASGGIFYNWSPGKFLNDSTIANPIAQPDSTMTFSVRVDVGNCYEIDSTTVTVIDADFALNAYGDDTICQNEVIPIGVTVTGNQGPYQYTWRPGISVNDSTTKDPFASPSTSTNYQVFVLGKNGCNLVDDVDVIVSGQGPRIFLEASKSVVCPGDTIELTAMQAPVTCGPDTVACNGIPRTRSVGVGNITIPTGSPTQYPSVYGNWHNSAKHQVIYRASDLNAAGLWGGQITSLAVYATAVFSNTSYFDFQIRIGCTNDDQLTSYTNNLYTVFQPKTVSIAQGWNTHELDIPFDWDGVSNLIVEFCFNNTSNVNLNTFMAATATNYTAMLYSFGSNNMCLINAGEIPSTVRPDMQFTMCADTVDPQYIRNWTPGVITLDSTRAVTRAVIDDPVTFSFIASDQWCQGANFISIDVDTTNSVEVSPDTLLCLADTVQLLTNVTGTPTNGSFTYTWSPSATLSNSSLANPRAFPNVTTLYKVKVDGGTCSVEDSVLISVGGISYSSKTNDVSCFGNGDGYIVVENPVSSSPPVNVTWNVGLMTDSIGGLNGGTYVAILSDSVGCFVTDTFTIFEADSIEIDFVATNLDCYNDSSGEILVGAIGGIAPYNYLWSNSQSGITITQLHPGSYSVIVTDSAGCVNQDSVSITEPSPLLLDLDSVDVTANAGNDGKVWTNVSGGTLPYFFSWSNGGNGDTISNLTAGCYSVTVTDQNGCSITDSSCIIEPTLVILNLSRTLNPCFGDSVATITVNASNAIPPYSYAWSTSIFDTTNVITDLKAGIYTVTVTDSTGSFTIASDTITDPPLLQIDIDTISVSCYQLCDGNGNVIVNGGTAGYAYSWNDGSNNASRNDLCEGVYSVSVSDLNGCTDSLVFALSQPDSLFVQVISTTDVSCYNGSDGAVSIGVQGGNGGYTYSWSNSSLSQNLNNVSANSYTVTVTDSKGCNDNASATLTQPTQIILSTSGVDASCFGFSDGEVSVSSSGGIPPYTYLWSNNDPNPSVTNISAGSYTVTVTDDNNCTASTLVTIDEPEQIQIQFATTNISCFEGNNGGVIATVSNGTPSYSYNWSNGSDESSINSLIAGTYYLTVTDSNGCTETATVSLNHPSQLLNSIITDSLSCAGLSDGSASVISTGGTAPYSYSWSNGEIQHLNTGLAEGLYTVTVTDANGCVNIDTAEVSQPRPITWADIQIDSTLCFNDSTGSISVSASGGNGGFEYSIDAVRYSPNSLFTGLHRGTHTVYVVDEENCEEDTTLYVAGPPPFLLNITPQDTAVALGRSIQLLSAFYPYTEEDVISYNWSPSTGLSCTDCPNPMVTTYQTEQMYKLKIMYSNNCMVVANVTVFVRNGVDYFIPNVFTPNNDGENDEFKIYGERIKTVRMKIFNRSGEQIFESDSQSNGWNGVYRGDVVNPGVYVYFAEIEYLNGTKELTKGSVTVIR